MNNILSFGKHTGRTFEWLIFNDPSYAEWIYYKGVYKQEHSFSEEEGEYFLELFKRASCLTGTCKWCRERPVTRMGLSSLLSGASNHIGFYCDKCEYPERSVTMYNTPSFFVEEHALARGEHKRIVTYIKDRYIGRTEKLTQAKMEEFFRNDANFVDATPGFFAREVVTV